MAQFQYRLARVLEWYRKRCRLEESRLGILVDSVAKAEHEMQLHAKDIVARQAEVIQSSNIHAFELAALSAFCQQAKKRELQLRENQIIRKRTVTHQQKVVQAAQQRLQLVQKLRDRRLEEHRYQEAKQIEELALESYLASFARNLNEASPN